MCECCFVLEVDQAKHRPAADAVATVRDSWSDSSPVYLVMRGSRVGGVRRIGDDGGVCWGGVYGGGKLVHGDQIAC